MFRSIARIAAPCLALFVACAAAAQPYPNKPITLIVPFAPGASADGIARVLARELQQELGQSVVVDNKPGAGGALGLVHLTRAAPDGYTIGMGATGAIAINPFLPDAPPLNPQRDLAPLAKVADIPLVLVTAPSSGYGNLKAFLNAARKLPMGLTYATAGQYTAHHLAGELLASTGNAPLLAVPYRGSAPAVTDVMGGIAPAGIVDLTSAYPQIKAGKLVALGVTSAARSKVALEIPTIAEEGVAGYAAPAWMGIFMPVKTLPAVSGRLAQALRKVMSRAEVRQQIQALSAEPSYADGPAFAQFIATESKRWGGVISRLPKKSTS